MQQSVVDPSRRNQMLFRLLLLFTLLPLVELTLLAWLSAHTDWRLAVLFVIGTGVLGAWLIRSQGWRAWVRIRDELARGQVPAESIQDGLLILVAGLLLITPGVLTDIVGVLLLVPPVRRIVRLWLRRRWQGRFVVRSFGTAGPGRTGDVSGRHDETVIDVTSAPGDGAD
jgi:UPF0716 protein FxsA